MHKPPEHLAALSVPECVAQNSSEANVAAGFSWSASHSLSGGVSLRELHAPKPIVASMPLALPRVETFGCVLPEGRGAAQFTSAKRGLTEGNPRSAQPTAGRETRPDRGRTRVRPPRDVVRLEDRLSYLLQPPLESLLEAESLTFPFRPFPYQLDGVAFLFPRRHAVLADEMGLGKTMQAITTLRLLAHSGQVCRALLVCPKPLVSNWRRELSEWAPDVSVATVEGPPARRRWIWTNRGAVVTIANYESLLRDELVTHEAGEFDLVILDESQRIKNRTSATNRVVCGIKRERSWALTGTPIENSVDDLVGIFDFVNPGQLRPGMPVRAIARSVQDTILRRTKERVLKDLPPKIIRDAQLELTHEQSEAYQRAEEEGVVRLNDLGAELTIQHVFQLTLRLKQICNFDRVTGASSKLERLEADLEECVASGRKAIVFSQWVSDLQRLAERLERFGPLQYHGKTPHKRRDSVIEQFRSDPASNVILMSYGAGSVGLNLQFAGYVFLFDRWWNPAVEDQAINRAHRIGATGPVTVTRFISTGTIEHRIDELLAQKRELAESVLSYSGEPACCGLTRRDLFSLFRLCTPDGPLDTPVEELSDAA